MKKLLFALLLSCTLLLTGCGDNEDELQNVVDYSEIFEYETGEFTNPVTNEVEEGVYIKKYLGNEQLVIIPNQIDGKDVLSINPGLFSIDYITKNKSVEVVVIPNTVSNIGDGQFRDGAPNLSSIIIDPDNEYLMSYRNGLYSKNETGWTFLCISIGNDITYYLHKDTTVLTHSFNAYEIIDTLVFEEGITINEMSPLIESLSFSTIDEVKVHADDYDNLIQFFTENESVVQSDLIIDKIITYEEE